MVAISAYRGKWIADARAAEWDGGMEIVAVTEAHAADIVTWEYPAPYESYSLLGADPGYFTDPANGFVALVEGGELIGYRSFGPDGRVPGGDYDAALLDTGGGLRPSLTGKGLGREAIATGLSYGERVLAPEGWRVTVAAFNERALRVVESLGFARGPEFAASTDGRPYRILTRPSWLGVTRSV